MDFKEVVKTRRSVRSYSQYSVPNEKLNKIFEAVRFSPSSYNLQPWKFVVVRSSEGKKKLFSCAQNNPHILSSSLTVIVCGLLNPVRDADAVFENRVLLGRATREQAEALKKQIVEKLSDEKTLLAWLNRSVSLAAMTLMYAARDQGLDSCPIEGFDAECVQKTFSFSEGVLPLMLVTIGKAAGDTVVPYKKSVEEIVEYL